MTARQLARAAWGAALLALGLGLLLDLWGLLGFPGRRCPACQERRGWWAHTCQWEDGPDAARGSAEGPTGDGAADLAALRRDLAGEAPP